MLDQLRTQPDDRLSFLRAFLRDPQRVGSVIPSSRFLERRLVEAAEISRAQVVVELGPGSGGTTRAMLRELPAEGRLLAIEIDPGLASLLETIDDPRLIVHVGSAADIADALAQYELPAPDATVSGIPFSTMPASLGKRILEEVWSSLAPDGRFAAYQFRDRVAQLGRPIAGEPEVIAEPRNIPPVRIFCWRKPAEPEKTPAV